MLKPRALKTQTLHVAAPPELVFQVVGAAGQRLEDRSEGSVFEFSTTVYGRTIKTTELLQFHEPTLITYQWLEGPLPHVLEEIRFTPSGDGTDIKYTGEYSTKRGMKSCIVGYFYVKRIFRRLVHQHLVDAKEISEKRAERSHLFKNGKTQDAD